MVPTWNADLATATRDGWSQTDEEYPLCWDKSITSDLFSNPEVLQHGTDGRVLLFVFLSHNISLRL